MKKSASFLCFLITSAVLSNSHATACTSDLDHKETYYTETTISETDTILTMPNIVPKTSKTITKTKTVNTKASDGTTLWSASITATFTYNGTTSKCISCSHNAKSYAKTWTIKSISSKKNDNTATATAIATHSYGNISKDFTQTITITCSKNGAIS